MTFQLIPITLFLFLQSFLGMSTEAGVAYRRTSFHNTYSVNQDTLYTIVGDSVLVPDFEIELVLSDLAEAKLKESKESIIVQAYFRGRPSDPNYPLDISSFGNLDVGDFHIELFDSRIAAFRNVKIPNKLFSLLKDRNFEVLINVYTGRRVYSDNLLHCDILQNKIESVMGKRHIIRGKLIYGDR